MEMKGLVLLVVDGDTQDIGWKKIRCKLDALEFGIYTANFSIPDEKPCGVEKGGENIFKGKVKNRNILIILK